MTHWALMQFLEVWLQRRWTWMNERERGIVAAALAVWVKYKKRATGTRKRKTLHIWMHNCVKCRFQQTLEHTHTDDAQMSCTKCRRTIPEGASFCNTLLSQADWNAPQRASQSILMLIDGRLKEASWSLRPVCLTRFKCADYKSYSFTPDLHWRLMHTALKNQYKSLVPITLTCLCNLFLHKLHLQFCMSDL